MDFSEEISKAKSEYMQAAAHECALRRQLEDAKKRTEIASCNLGVLEELNAKASEEN